MHACFAQLAVNWYFAYCMHGLLRNPLLVLLLLLSSVAGTPTGVTATRTGYSSIRVSWTASSMGALPAKYVVFYHIIEKEDNISQEETSNTDLTLNGLTLGSYCIFVKGFGAEGDAAVLPSASSQPTTITIGIQSITMCIIDQLYACHLLLCTDIPLLPSAPMLYPNTSSIVVSWSPTQFTPTSYKLSYSCNPLCASSSNQKNTSSANGTITTHKIAAAPGSTCMVNVTAVFGNNSSNTITNFTNTLSAGVSLLQYINALMIIIIITCISSPYWSSCKSH